MLYCLYRIGLFLVRHCGRRVSYAIAFFCSWIQYTFSRRDRDLVKGNLRVVMPEADDKELSRAALLVFNNFGRYLIDFFSLIKNDKGYLRRVVVLEGLQNIDEALKAGRGCVLMTGHFGNWELAGCAIADKGYKVNAIALQHADSRINDLFIMRRRLCGINVLPVGASSSVCLDALRRNEIVGILGDRPFGDRGIEINFFGKKAVFPRGAALFSLKSGSPIVFVFSYWDSGKNSYTVELDRPFFAKPGGNIPQQLGVITQAFACRFEQYIKKYPSQWYMFAKIWS